MTEPNQSPSPHRVHVEIVAPIQSWPVDFPRPEVIARYAAVALTGIVDIDRLRTGMNGGGSAESEITDDSRSERRIAFALNISIDDDAGIAEINREQRQKDRATDVLSFPSFEFPPGPGTAEIDPEELQFILNEWPTPDASPVYEIGDIVISHETCSQQAQEIGHSVLDEFQRLLVHGILHLFGYDHETGAEDEARMRAREDQLLALLDTMP